MMEIKECINVNNYMLKLINAKCINNLVKIILHVPLSNIHLKEIVKTITLVFASK